ncbi:osmotically inducible protein OsmC [Isoptericola sp. CG 20/1183]|uniref:Osmotically inducible protein OsmC n=1 Tax=Isoptericola halotolerans TaxID=300560 RepID=A0ABX5EGS9_9MICO|nr:MULTISPECIES: OsmC family peroxiredoxin [Isoptericola]PRZ08222.1 osmotically inducible protein OsmC [Isoptericola halotolerans]PRZ09019.1 osmotically inducible protein OsmC [Isoptericola sp. CG 20/1183]
MPTRTARTAWNGTLQEGSGQLELSSSGTGTFPVSFPQRAADDADGTTSPEELVAAAHSSCFAMAFSGELGNVGATPEQVEVTADVTLSPDPAGGFQISTIALSVRGYATGTDEAGFRKAAEDAKLGCPISKALAGVGDITLDVSYEG